MVDWRSGADWWLPSSSSRRLRSPSPGCRDVRRLPAARCLAYGWAPYTRSSHFCPPFIALLFGELPFVPYRRITPRKPQKFHCWEPTVLHGVYTVGAPGPSAGARLRRRGKIMSVAEQVAAHLPYLRRFARAVTGTQKSGDAYVVSTLEAILADPTVFPDDFAAACGPLPDLPKDSELHRLERRQGPVTPRRRGSKPPAATSRF